MTDWGVLDNGMDSGYNDDDVEFVGVVEEEEDVPQVQVPTRPVQRVARQPHYPARMQSQSVTPIQMSNGAKNDDGMAYFPTETGAKLAMNHEALQNMRTGGVHDVGGRTAMRVSPGTYVTYGPSQSASGQPQMNPAQAQGMGSWIEDLIGGVTELGTGIAASVAQTRTAREQADLERERLRLESEAATEARQYAHEQSQMEHEQALQTLAQRRAELEELQQAEEAATAAAQQRAAAEAAAAAASTGTTQTTGTSPVVWIVLAIVAMGGLGGAVYFFTRKKDKEE